MPFTLAHPAAVLPVFRTPLVPSALVVGTIAPDLPYYVSASPLSSDDTHTFSALVGVDLLIGAVLLAGFHLMLRRPLVALAPDAVRSRLPPGRRDLRWSAVPLVLFSLIAGSATHLGWDSFTQTHGSAVQAFSLLRTSVVGPHRLYNVIQYVSSLGGLVALAVWIVRWYRRTSGAAVDDGLPRPVRPAVWALVAVAAATGMALGSQSPVARYSDYDLVREVLLGAITGVAVVFGVYVLAWHLGYRGHHWAAIRRRSVARAQPSTPSTSAPGG